MTIARRLSWPGCFNVRDLGGLPLPSGAATPFKRVVRADNLDRLTDAGFEALLDHGIQNIIDLREEVETSRYSRTPVLARFHGVRITRTQVLRELSTRERSMLATSHDTVETYLWILKHCKQGVARTFRELATITSGGTVIHCHAGRDRTGIIAALLLSLCGVANEHIAEDYAESAPQLAAIYEKLLQRATSAAERAALLAESRSNANDLLLLLQTLEQEYGGAHHYLRNAGLSDAELANVALFLNPLS